MSDERPTYVDSSALVKLVVREPETAALRLYLRRRGPLVSSALARTEVVRALLLFGAPAVARAAEVLARVDLVRVNDRVLSLAGNLLPFDLRSLDAIHLATARLLGPAMRDFVTYDRRMAAVAATLGFRVAAPG